MAVITDRDAVKKILGHLGMPEDAPPLGRARAPDDLDSDGYCMN